MVLRGKREREREREKNIDTLKERDETMRFEMTISHLISGIRLSYLLFTK